MLPTSPWSPYGRTESRNRAETPTRTKGRKLSQLFRRENLLNFESEIVPFFLELDLQTEELLLLCPDRRGIRIGAKRKPRCAY